jgi:6-phosphogluconate dehydrogenase (decarboxylating)
MVINKKINMIGRYICRNFSSLANKKVGFIGLGNMGYPMVQNLLNKGYKVTAFDLDEEVLKQAESAGATIAPDPKETSIDQDIVFTMLPNTAIVQETRGVSVPFVNIVYNLCV